MVKQALVILNSCQSKIEEAVEFFNINGFKSDKMLQLKSELAGELLSKVDFALCKCQAKYLMQQYQSSQKIEVKQQQNMKSVEFDSVFDLLFSSDSKPKTADNLEKRVRIGEQKALLNVLENAGSLQITDQAEDSAAASKVKVTKQVKLVNYLPKLKSVPATPQFFDMAGGYVQYPDFEQESKKYESAAAGFFSGFWG